jgi:hypothetical protein
MLLYQSTQISLNASHVALSTSGIHGFIAAQSHIALLLPRWDAPFMFQGPTERVLGWFFAFNAVNYSFWPTPGQARWFVEIGERRHGNDDEAFGVMAAFSHAMNHGLALDDSEVLLQLDLQELERILEPAPGAGQLPLMASRLEALHELGSAYQRLDGPLGLLKEGRSNAPKLAQALVRQLPSWEDSRVYRGQRIRFLKRAQLCAAMLYGRFGGSSPCDFSDVDKLTAFADYRLPQILRHHRILRFSEALEAQIQEEQPLLKGSEEEVEIRCATIVAVEQLRQGLDQHWPGITALQVDYLLWRSAIDCAEALPAFHRCRTTDY